MNELTIIFEGLRFINDPYLFDKVDAELAMVGLTVDTKGRPGDTPGWVIRLRENNVLVNWPPDPPLDLDSGLLIVKFRPVSGRWAVLEFSISVNKDVGSDADARFSVPVSAMRTCYHEDARDVLLRAFMFAENLASSCEVSKVRVVDFDFDHDWFAIIDGKRDKEPLLPIDDAGRDHLELLATVIAENELPITVDKRTGAYVALVPCGSSDVLGLLRKSPLNGELLPEPSVDHDFYPTDDAVDLKYLKTCWRFERGMRDVVLCRKVPLHHRTTAAKSAAELFECGTFLPLRSLVDDHRQSSPRPAGCREKRARTSVRATTT